MSWWSPSKFQGEAQGPLGGGAGALLQGGSRVEEKTGEGEAREGREAKGEASKEIVKVSAKGTDPRFAWLLFQDRCSTDHSHRAYFKKNIKNHLQLPVFRILKLRSII